MASEQAIVIVPGFGGSSLWVDWDNPYKYLNGEVWWNLNSLIAGQLDWLKLKSDGLTPDTFFGGTIYARDILDRYYGSIINFFRGEGRFYTTYWVYDFRLNLSLNADLFAAWVRTVQGRWPLRIIAHSMGGVVARLMLSRLTPAELEAAIYCVCALGTPHYGSLTMTRSLAGIERAVWWLNAVTGNTFLGLAILHAPYWFTSIMGTWPGAAQLLPNPNSAFGIAQGFARCFDRTNYGGAAPYLKQPVLDLGKAWWAPNISIPAGVKWFDFTSTTYGTPDSINAGKNFADDDALGYGLGDGVVTYESAIAEGSTVITAPMGHSAYLRNGAIFQALSLICQFGAYFSDTVMCPADPGAEIF